MDVVELQCAFYSLHVKMDLSFYEDDQVFIIKACYFFIFFKERLLELLELAI